MFQPEMKEAEDQIGKLTTDLSPLTSICARMPAWREALDGG